MAIMKLPKQTRGVSITLWWPCHLLTLKSILSQKKKNYANSNISPLQKNNLPQKKNPLKETKILQDIIITLL
jgi:hypothetical protein